ncbi:AMP-binding protein [Sphingomonas solaris]|uniref:AMP-binding protein n=1 Tax=Alterirhizorhabdus solaris TaxID=2529389 RepID=A0A558R547_9SPHN|nr:AMP-binding protein [Sphingomonas solaris]TVV74462.1 AMP-binding protein [Sphingomonas solaris]
MTRLVETIRAHGGARPDAVAIDGGIPVTWRALADTLPDMAAALATRFDPARPVGLRIDHGMGETLLDLAFLEAGVPTLALPSFFTRAQAAQALHAAGAQALLSGPVGIVDGIPSAAVSAIHGPAVPLPPGTARITFTSGSTGHPKGVCLSLEHMLTVAGAVVDTLGSHHAGRHLPLLPPGILLEGVAGLLATMLAGGTYVAMPQADAGLADPFRADLARMLAAIENRAVTSLILVPEYLAGLVGVMTATSARLPRLSVVAVGGARLNPDLLASARAVGLPIRQGYGLTECGSVVTLDDGTAAGMGSVGASIGANAISVAEDGEILIDGPLFLGTLDAPRGPGALATGDIGRIDAAGRLWIEGRKSALIVTSFGRNVSPEWVESVLTAQPAIAQAMARGDGRAMLDALIVPASPTADIHGAVAAANASLPVYARVGQWRAVAPFTSASGLLTGNGRLRRAAIDAAHPYRETHMTQPFFDRLVAATAPAQMRFAATPQLRAGLAGDISSADYIAYLIQAYHHVRHTVPLMREARARLDNQPEIVAAFDDYIAEETGHEQWILDDIERAGGDRIAAGRSTPAPATHAMVDHAYRTIREDNPIALFGMIYVLEGTSIALASQGAGALQHRLGLPDDAVRYLTSHGALDQDHMTFFARLMNRINDPVDQEAIIAMADAMFGLFGALFAGIELEAQRVAA